jgi:hypothetical protein
VCIDELKFEKLQFKGDPGRAADAKEAQRQARAVGKAVCKPDNLAKFGLADPATFKGDKLEMPVIESVRTSRRVGPDGQLSFDLVAEVVQCRKVERPGKRPFEFFGGVTLILGSEGQIRYVIGKSIENETRLDRQQDYVGRGDIVVHALHNCRYQKKGGTPPATPAPAAAKTPPQMPASPAAKKPRVKKRRANKTRRKPGR